MASARTGSTQRGFTLIEMLITVVVLGVLTAIAVPGFTNFVRDGRRAATLNELVGALSLARSEAVKRGIPVSVCRAVTDTACATGTSGWGDGWLVFVNADNDSPAVIDVGELVLRARLGPDANFTLQPSALLASSITYIPDGSVNGGVDTNSLTYCDQRGPPGARAVLISRTGRARLSRDTDNNGIEEDASNADLVCS